MDDQDPLAAPCLSIYDPSGAVRCVLNGSNEGVWTGDGRIAALQGMHASESRAVVLSGADFSSVRTLPQPVGFKSGLTVKGDRIEFFNTARIIPFEKISAPLGGSGEYTSTMLGPALPAGVSIPTAADITYPSTDGRTVPSTLLLPPAALGKCESTAARFPAIVYVHGGSVPDNSPQGQGPPASWDDQVLMAKAGYAVIDANYYGDVFTGVEYRAKRPRDLGMEGLDPEMADVFAAGQYAKSLPCVDSARIAVFGHSLGAIIAALYVVAVGK